MRSMASESAQNVILDVLKHEFQSGDAVPHSHDTRWELLYLRQGLASYTVEEQSFSVRSGALMIIAPGTMHGASYHASDRSGKLERYVLGLEGVSQPLLPAGMSPLVRLDMTNILTSMFQLLEREFLARDAGWEAVCNGVLEALFALIARGATKEQQAAPQKATQAQMLAQEIIAYLHVHYCENLNLQIVADQFYISTYYLSHLMKKQLQIPLMQYVIHLRISEAQVLLRDTDYSVKQIAQMVGYQNFNYFFNVFKKIVGTSPGECRARSRE